ncbi:MAG: hypothetical protein IPI97_15365 [Nitrosomonas sp.]|nr:hypothetical protein [Nitrosomonas sp.]
MGYLVQGKCVDTLQKADHLFASYCGVQADGSFIYYCYANNLGGINFIRETFSTGAIVTQTSVVTYPPCDIEVNSTSELAWLVAGVWVVAGIQKMIEVMRR